MSEQIQTQKGIYNMTKAELIDEIFKLKREVQFQIDCKENAQEKLEIAESQGFFDGYYFTWAKEAWVKKDW